MASSEAGPSSIPLYVINGVATVWDAQTAATLHCAHDISGMRAGTLPGVVQQNAFLGLPLTLMPEETTHLVESGVAHLVHVTGPVSPPSADIVAERTAQRIARSRATAMHVRHEEAKAAAAAKAKYNKVDAKATAKREERARKKALKARDASVAAGTDPAEAEAAYEAALAAIASPESAPAAPELGVDDSVPTAANSNFFTVVPAAPVLPALQPAHTETSVPAPCFPFPTTLRDTAIASVFRKLHSSGLRMGLGPRFGGEWLVYPGDFLRYHAHFTSQVIKNNEPIRPAELIAWGRLGTGTKKASLICCWNTDEKDDAGPEDSEFYSLEWANFG